MASTGKKIAIGCGVVVMIIGLLCCSGGIYSWMKLRQLTASFEKWQTDLAELDTRFPFTPPADGVYSEDRLEAFFEVREDIVTFFTTDPAVAKLQQAAAGDQSVGPFAMMRAAFDLVRRGGAEIARVFNDASMSPREFAHLAEAVHTTIAVAASDGDAEFADLHESLRTAVNAVATVLRQQNQHEFVIDYDSMTDEMERNAPPADPQTIEVIRRHIEEMQSNPYLAYFELFMMEKR